MADSQATPTIELQTPPNWSGSLAETPEGRREQIAGAADEARRHVEEGFTTADLRKELKRSKRNRAWKRFGIVLGVIVALIAAAAVAVVVFCSVNPVNSDAMAPTLQNGRARMRAGRRAMFLHIVTVIKSCSAALLQNRAAGLTS